MASALRHDEIPAAKCIIRIPNVKQAKCGVVTSLLKYEIGLVISVFYFLLLGLRQRITHRNYNFPIQPNQYCLQMCISIL